MVLEHINETRVDAFSGFLEPDRPVFVTTSNANDFTDLASAILEAEPSARVNVLTDSGTLNEVRRRFLTASHFAEFVDADVVRIRIQDRHLPSFLVTQTELTTITGIDDSLLATFSRDGSAFVERTYEEIERRFEAGGQVSLRAPAYSAMLEELGEELGESMRTDVTSMLEQALATRDDESDIDPTRLTILAGARNEVQLYELSRWGEDAGVASRSKYSREKTRLEDLGLVDTEKVPTGVGRPRQRLVLADDVADTGVAELLSLTESVIV